MANSKKYELFILEPDRANTPPIRTDQEEESIDLKIESLGMNAISGDEFVKRGANMSETKNWDDGNLEDSEENLPLVDLSSEE